MPVSAPIGAVQQSSLPGQRVDAPAAPVATGARLLPLRHGFYAFRLMPRIVGGSRVADTQPPAVRICAAPQAADVRVAGLSGRPAPWLQHSERLFVTAPAGGTTVLLTGYRTRGSEPEPIEIEVLRLDRDRSERSVGWTDGNREMPDTLGTGALVLGLAPDSADLSDQSAFETVALIGGEGEVRFVDTGWAGRPGRGRWIEAFTLIPRGPLPMTAVEYKALTADGEETGWVGGGAPCGTTGTSVPLVGFAVRHRPASGPPQFDCEYSGYFQSGANVGPVRNGAPCLSPTANDPLEGLRVRMLPRPALKA